MRQKIILLVFLLAAFLPLSAQTALKTDEAELRHQAFDKVWNTVYKKHYDETFGGVDWKKMHDIYEPRAMTAKTLDDFHGVLRQMLGELKLSHFGIYPGDLTSQVTQAGGGVTGVEIKMIETEAVIYRIEKDSTAEKAGLKTGFVIRKIDEKTIEELLAPLEKTLPERTRNENVRKVYRERALTFRLVGKPRSVVRIEVLNAKNEPQTFDVERYAAKTEISKPVGNFPSQEVVFEARRLAGGVGYIRFNVWVVPQLPKIKQAIRDFSDAKGIIFDLRGNPGGVGGIALGVAGFLINEKTSLGTMKTREATRKFVAYPQDKPFLGKIMILTDYGTGSTSEVFAAGLQDLGRAKIIGERSAGAVLPSVFDKLPTGVIFQYVISDYKSPKDILIEGRGVLPDTEVKQTREALIEGRDLQIETAVGQISN
jgi:carboxyl-terminal processing protease